VSVRGIAPEWPQADLAILSALETMGSSVVRSAGGVTVSGRATGPVRVDLDDAPDLLPLLGVLGATTPGRTVLRGASHADGKESDRRRETARLARAMGAKVTVSARQLSVEGRGRPRHFDYGGAADHRMVMSAAVGAIAGDGPSRIGSAECVAKSFPAFWSVFEGLTNSMGPSR
jgi:3-phosphoshikimate 1-carboxyvinyltransferase